MSTRVFDASPKAAERPLEATKWILYPKDHQWGSAQQIFWKYIISRKLLAFATYFYESDMLGNFYELIIKK